MTFKFKTGDRVVFIGPPRDYHTSVATVVRYDERGRLEVRHDGIDYRLDRWAGNCHNSYPDEFFELEALLKSPLYKALL
jgi:hypothetical protein